MYCAWNAIKVKYIIENCCVVMVQSSVLKVKKMFYLTLNQTNVLLNQSWKFSSKLNVFNQFSSTRLLVNKLAQRQHFEKTLPLLTHRFALHIDTILLAWEIQVVLPDHQVALPSVQVPQHDSDHFGWNRLGHTPQLVDGIHAEILDHREEDVPNLASG